MDPILSEFVYNAISKIIQTTKLPSVVNLNFNLNLLLIDAYTTVIKMFI